MARNDFRIKGAAKDTTAHSERDELKAALATAVAMLDDMVNIFEVMFKTVRAGEQLSVEDIATVEMQLPSIKAGVANARRQLVSR